jgi:hypothetical protein
MSSEMGDLDSELKHAGCATDTKSTWNTPMPVNKSDSRVDAYRAVRPTRATGCQLAHIHSKNTRARPQRFTHDMLAEPRDDPVPTSDQACKFTSSLNHLKIKFIRQASWYQASCSTTPHSVGLQAAHTTSRNTKTITNHKSTTSLPLDLAADHPMYTTEATMRASIVAMTALVNGRRPCGGHS